MMMTFAVIAIALGALLTAQLWLPVAAILLFFGLLWAMVETELWLFRKIGKLFR